MKLGRLKLSNKLMLAPMLKVTTAPYRRFCRTLSGKIGLVFVPMLYTKRIVKCPKSVIEPLYRISEERPIGVQLIGSDPIALKKTIEHLESYEFDVLDINAGCPSRRAVKLQEGGYILNNLNNLAKIINVATKHSSRPVSVKIRIGVYKPLNLQSLSRIINDSGLEFITVHGRTVKEKFDDSKLNLEFVRNLKEEVNIPIIGNGSIDSPQFAEHFLKYTRVDGLMIGRASIGNPEIFKQIGVFLEKKIILEHENTIPLFLERVKIYEKCIDEFINDGLKLKYPLEKYKFNELFRNSIWLTKGLKEATFLRRFISKASNLEQLKKVINQIKDGKFKAIPA